MMFVSTCVIELKHSILDVVYILNDHYSVILNNFLQLLIYKINERADICWCMFAYISSKYVIKLYIIILEISNAKFIQ